MALRTMVSGAVGGCGRWPHCARRAASLRLRPGARPARYACGLVPAQLTFWRCRCRTMPTSRRCRCRRPVSQGCWRWCVASHHRSSSNPQRWRQPRGGKALVLAAQGSAATAARAAAGSSSYPWPAPHPLPAPSRRIGAARRHETEARALRLPRRALPARLPQWPRHPGARLRPRRPHRNCSGRASGATVARSRRWSWCWSRRGAGASSSWGASCAASKCCSAGRTRRRTQPRRQHRCQPRRRRLCLCRRCCRPPFLRHRCWWRRCCQRAPSTTSVWHASASSCEVRRAFPTLAVHFD
jgi:hypothetical protein